MSLGTAKRITRILILSTLGLWLGWDLYAFHWHGNPATISRIVFDWVRDYLPIFFALFYTLGHLTWGQRDK